MTLRRFALLTAVVLGALAGTGPAAAWGHPVLISATPQPGVVADKAPGRISLALSEKAVARGSQIRLFAGDGRPLAASAVTESAGGRTLSVVPSTPLGSAVYRVAWSALGEDGHVVSGRFTFGVAGANGQAPGGVEKLGPAGAGRGTESDAADGVMTILGRWLGIMAASFLLAAAVLRRRLRAPILQEVHPLAWVLLLAGAVEGVIAAAGQGPSGSLDFSLATASPTGVSALVRVGLVLGISLLLLVAKGGRATLYGVGGGLALLTYALSGPVFSSPSAWSLLVMATHVVAAGLWLGGVIVLALASARGSVRLPDGVRAFAPLGGAALAAAAITGVLSAIREVDRWYFLRWSGYGEVIIVKTAFVLLVSMLGVIAWRRSRGPGAAGPPRRLVRAEAFGVVVVLALATVLSGLAQGRGQLLPAQKGTLFPGPALTTAVFSKSSAHVAVAPARAGDNVVAVSIPPGRPEPTEVSVRLTCGDCRTAPIRAGLAAHGDATWSAPVSLPRDGTWSAQVTIDGETAPSEQIPVGVPDAPGAPAAQVLAIADMTGPGAERCRANLIGLELALARINANGGVDGGRKVAPLVLDSGGTAAGAAAAAARGLRSHPIALAGACGTGAVAAVDAAAKAGVPSIVSDPAVDPTAAPGVFRLAADPYAQGVSFGQLVRNRIMTASIPGVRTVRAIAGEDLQGRRLLAGLREGLRASSAVDGMPVTGATPKLVVMRPGSLAALTAGALSGVLDRTRNAAVVLDGPAAGGPDATAVARLGAARGEQLTPPPILASERVLSESFVEQAGSLGRIGAIQGVSEVSPATPDAELYQTAVSALFRGDLGSLDGLRGYTAGLALVDALRNGTSRAKMLANLRRPSVFTDALLAPWSPDRPGSGEPYVIPLQPQFLSARIDSGGDGGSGADSKYFPAGDWTITAQIPLGITTGVAWPRI